MNYSVKRLVLWSLVISDRKECTVKERFSIAFHKPCDHAQEKREAV